MKKNTIALIFLLFCNKALAFDIVSDPTHMAQTIAGWGAQAADMASQLNQLKQQYQQMQQQYQSITGSRGMGTIMNNPALRSYLPDNWKGVYDSVKSGGYSGLSGTGQSVYNANKIYDSCGYMTTTDQRIACEARAVKPSQDKGFAMDAYDTANSRINQIDQLMEQINQTHDPKDIAELQARIGAEQANIQNEQTKLQLYSMVAAADEKVQAQQQREIQARTWSAKKGITVQPLTFGN